jgi:hypothetical protein
MHEGSESLFERPISLKGFKEFKRRIKPMEIVAGENACYRLSAFVSLKAESHWRANPLGKVNANLPFFKEIAQKESTQET